MCHPLPIVPRKLDHIDKRLWRQGPNDGLDADHCRCSRGIIYKMTQLVFALVVTMGAQTISIEHWSGVERCLWYAKQLNSQHHHIYQKHHRKDDVIHAKCILCASTQPNPNL